MFFEQRVKCYARKLVHFDKIYTSNLPVVDSKAMWLLSCVHEACQRVTRTIVSGVAGCIIKRRQLPTADSQVITKLAKHDTLMLSY